jgi:hypothetical protein
MLKDNCSFQEIQCHGIYKTANKLENSVGQIRKEGKFTEVAYNRAMAFFKTANKNSEAVTNKFHNKRNYSTKKYCSLRSLSLTVAACPDKISAVHSRLLLPQQMNLLSSFKRIYKRLSACQFYTLALSESTM